MSHQSRSAFSHDQARQIQNSSSPASPQQPVAAATNTGQLDSGISPGSPPLLPQSTIVVDVVSSLLAGRTDAAAILAAVVARLEPSSGQTNLQLQQPDSLPAFPAFASPPTAAVLGANSDQQDVQPSFQALSVSSLSSGVTSGSSYVPTVKSEACSPAPFITADAMPDALKTSPSYALIGQVLRAPVDPTSRDWRVRNFYEQDAVTTYHRWSQPEGQPHRDASDALAELSDPDVLAVPAALRLSNPDTSAAAWDHYRRLLIHSLHRAFAAGVDWARALRAMSLVYSGPTDGHPRINQYIESAMTDRALVLHPLLHADVLLFKLDTSFASGSRLYSKDSRAADWERTTERLPGEDVVTLATRITEAYVKKVSDPKIDSVSVWSTAIYAAEIYERFVRCLNNDPTGPPERGTDTHIAFMTIYGKTRQQIAQGERDASSLNIIEIAMSELEPRESARIALYDDVDDDASQDGAPADSRHRYTTAGRGARARRADRRLALANMPLQ